MSVFVYIGAALMALGYGIMRVGTRPHPLMGHNPDRPVLPLGPLLMSGGFLVVVVGISRS